MRENLGNNQYDLIVLIYCDLGVFSPDDRKRVFQKVYDALKQGGYFIFDVFTPKKYENFEATRTWNLEENNFWTKEACLHLTAQKNYRGTMTYLEQHYLIYPDFYKEFFIWETVFSEEELLTELKELGFLRSEIYGDMRGTINSSDSETRCFIMEK